MAGEIVTAKVLRIKGYSSRFQDEASSAPGRQQHPQPQPQLQAGGVGSQAIPRAHASTKNNVVDEQQMQSFPSFRKPRLDVSVASRESSFSMIEEDGNANRSGSNSDREASATPGTGQGTDLENDGSKVADSSSFIVGDCSTCGDVGFQTELFRCTKCCVRLQHRYCSNSYNPRKRWLIKLCNWCEAEGATALPSPQPQITGTGSSKINSNQAQPASSKRDSSSPWGSGAASRSADRSSNVECLLGAALRLPGAGFSSVEDLLQVNDSSNVSSSSGSSKRKKPPSFDSVEKARRSGPGGDIRAVKSFKRPATVEKPVAAAAPVRGELSPPSAMGGDSQRSSSSSVDNGEQPQQQQRRSPSLGDHVSTIKVKKSPTTTGGVRSPAAAAAGETAGTISPTTTSPGGTKSSASAGVQDAKAQTSTEPASATRHQRTEVNGGGRDAGPKEDSSTTRAARASSCDSSERHEQSSTSTTTSTGEAGGGGEATVVDKAASTSKLSPSNSSRKIRVLSSKSPKSSPRPVVTSERSSVRDNERTATVPEVSSSSPDNAAVSRTMKRSNSTAHAVVDHSQKIRKVPSFKNEVKENNSVGKKSMSISRPRESNACGVAEAPPSKRPRTTDGAEKTTTTKSPTASFSKPPSMRSPAGDGDEHSDNSKSSGGGSDCSNVTQEQRRQQQQQKHNKGGGTGGGKDLPSTSSADTKCATVKHQPQQMATGGPQKLARDRPTYSSSMVGKSGAHPSRISSSTDERVQKKASNHKDTSGKFRRNSSKITGIHNYKSLSDILC